MKYHSIRRIIQISHPSTQSGPDEVNRRPVFWTLFVGPITKKNIIDFVLLVLWHSWHLASPPTNRSRCKCAADYTQTAPTHQQPLKTFALDFSRQTASPSAERWQTEVCSHIYCLLTIMAVINTTAPAVLIICWKGLLTGCMLFKLLSCEHNIQCATKPTFSTFCREHIKSSQELEDRICAIFVLG